jgi:hypothetical protein
MAQAAEEYLAYVRDGATGFNLPIVAIVRFDGPILYRDFVREDLARIPDTFSIPGGWFFKRNPNSPNSWTRRFGLLRGKYMFLFHSPLNEKPVAIVSLVNTVVAVPPNGAKSFDSKTALANEGYEWEIQNTVDADETTQIYSLSAVERNQWVAACQERSQRVEEGRPIQILLGTKTIPTTRQGSNVTITATRLEGESPSSVANFAQAEDMEMAYHSYSNPYYMSAPPPPPPPDDDTDDAASYYRYQHQQQQQL